MENKNSVGLVIGLILAAGISVTLIIFLTSLSGSVFQTVESDISDIGNNVVLNEPLGSILNGTRSYFDHGFIQEGTLSIFNSTSGTIKSIGLANYTIDYDAGTIDLHDHTYNGTSVYANYTWGVSEIRGSIGNSVMSGFEAQEKSAKYIPLIILALVIGIILSILPFWGNKGQEGSPL